MQRSKFNSICMNWSATKKGETMELYPRFEPCILSLNSVRSCRCCEKTESIPGFRGTNSSNLLSRHSLTCCRRGPVPSSKFHRCLAQRDAQTHGIGAERAICHRHMPVHQYQGHPRTLAFPESLAETAQKWSPRDGNLLKLI